MPENEKVIVDKSKLTAIADKIRETQGTQDNYTLDQMPNYIGVSSNLQPNKVVSAETIEKEVVADEGYDGLEKVTIEAVTSTIDNNIQAGNIKEGVSILGVTGNYPNGQLTIDTNGTVDVKDYKTALVNVTAEGVDEANVIPVG